MDRSIFATGMQELEDCFDHAYKEPALDLFWSRLQGFANEDFTLAVKDLSVTCQRFPALSQIHEACIRRRMERVRETNNGERPPDTPASKEVVCPRCGADNTQDRPDVPTIIRLGEPVADGKRRFNFCCGACNTVF